jgi:phospholipase A-2-activating protein
VSDGSKDVALSPSEVETVVALCGQLESSQQLQAAFNS